MDKVIVYLQHRFSDSKSLSETISRIYHHIEVRPVCKEDGKELTYNCFSHPFHMFCCKKCANNNEETKEHLRQSCLEKYGVTNTAKAEITKRHYRERMEKKYGAGITNAYQAKSVINKIEDTKERKYGSRTYNNREKAEKTCLEQYGVSSASQISSVRKRSSYRYMYHNISFDSAPEIAFYIWLNDVKDILDIDFEYSPDTSFKYEYCGKMCTYMPDFRIGDQYFELKGDHFFKDGKMICPFRDKSWTDQQYDAICDKYETKHQCMIKNNVIIFTSRIYQFFIDYVNSTYGHNYCKQFKNNDEDKY